MEILLLIGAILFIGIIVGMVQGSNSKARHTALTERTTEAHPDSKVFTSYFDTSYMALDFESGTAVFGLDKERGGPFNPEQPYERSCAFKDILEVEVRRDGNTVTSTNRGSQALGAAVGAVALGGLGALLGGLSGSTKSTERIKKISLLVRVDDPDHPTHEITFFQAPNPKKGVKTDSTFLVPHLKPVETFEAHLINAMRRGQASQAAEVAPQSSTAQAVGGDMTAAIRELWALKQEGALTEEEFQAGKARLMNAGTANS